MIAIRQERQGLEAAIYRAQMQQAEELCDDMAQHFWPMIGTANQTAYVAMDDAIEAMEACGIFRQQVKVKAQRAMAEYERYDKAVKRHFHEIGDDRYYLWADLVSRAADRLQPDVDKLYYAIKQKIDEQRVVNSVALAKIQTALALVTLSVLMYDTMAAQYQRMTVIRIAETFRGGRLTGVESNWKEVGDITGRQVLQEVNLRDDPTCALGVQVILARYQRAEFLNDAAGEALRLNPSIEEKYLTDKTE